MKSYKLGEIASFFQGKQVDLENQFLNKDENHNVRFVRIADYTNSDEPIRYIENLGEKYYAREGDLVMIRYGSQTAGKVVMGKSGIIANNMFKINLDNTVANNEFMYYYLSQPHIFDYLRRAQSSSTMPAINFGMLNNFEVIIPNIDIQEKIVSILKKLDDRIKINTQINDNLYEITNKLYEQLFFIERKDDWKEYNLQELMDISNGYSYTGKELVDTSVVGMATIKNFERTGGFKEEGFKDIEPIKAKDVHYADKFDILVACTDLTQNADIIGNAIMLLNSSRYEKVVISMDLVKILPKKNKYLVFSILNSKEFKNFALGYKTGTTVLHLNKNCFKDFNIRLPDLDKVENFEKMVETNYKKISYNLEENDMLIQLRDTLLPKLMNGEIDLDKIEI